MFISGELLLNSIEPFGINLKKEQVEKLDFLAKSLYEYNQKFNLTAIKDVDGIVIKHFVDSLIPLSFVNLPQNSSLADVGTGAGFPGLVFLIARDDIKATLFDSTKKKLSFVDYIIRELSLNGKTVHKRAEEAAKGEYRESFDSVTARAVADLRILNELCLPLVKKGGKFYSMKGDLNENEKDAGAKTAKKLGGEMEDIIFYEIPPNDKRSLVIFKKISQTSINYPRLFTQISKNPL